MTLPAGFTTALATRHSLGRFWIEIAGHPTCYGNFALSTAEAATWFAGRAAKDRFLEIKPWALSGTGADGTVIPEMSSQEIDHTEGRVSLGTLRFAISDVDGSLAALTASRRQDGDWLRVTTDLTAAAASVAMIGCPRPAGVSTAWGSTGVAYIGAEAMTYTARTAESANAPGSLTLGTRGAYRTQAAAHSGHVGAVSQWNGALLTRYPRRLAGRSCWLYWTLDGATAADALLVFAGRINGSGWDNAGQTLVLQCDDQQAKMKRPIFTDLAFAPNGGAVPSYIRDAQTGTDYRDLSGVVPGDFTIGETFLIHDALSDAVTTYAVDSKPSGYVRLLADSTVWNGLAAEGGSITENFRRVVGVFESVGAMTGYTKFTAGVHPLQVMLQILTSTGLGTNTAAAPCANYDTLPTAWGCGIPVADLDIAGIEATIAATPGWRWQGVVFDEVPDAREWIVAQLLKPFGFYLRVRTGGTIGVGWIHAPTPADRNTLKTLVLADLLVDDRGQIAGLSGPVEDLGAVVSALEVGTSPTLDAGKTELGVSFTARCMDLDDPESDVIEGKTAKIECEGLHFGGRRVDGSIANLAITTPEIGAFFADLIVAYALRFSRPPSVLTVDTSLAKLDLDVGDMVSVTLANMPTSFSSTRGYAAQLMEVTQRKVDLQRGSITFDLAESGFALPETRFVSPALAIASWVDGTKTATVTQNAYTDSAGSYDDTSAFSALDDVIVYSADLSQRSIVTTVQSITATTIVLEHALAALTLTPAAGFVIMHADYPQQVARTQVRYASCAGPDGFLSTSTTPHVFD